MMRRLRDLVSDEEGQDLIEYALLASLLAIASVAALQTLGPVVAEFYASVEAAFQG